MAYTSSRFRTRRRPTREVPVGTVGVGGSHPIRVQSMTTADTRDVRSTVEEAAALAEAGCEIVRITAPNLAAARCLKDIRRELDRRRIGVPLVADIHFLPNAALEAVEHVEKVRINPGNYADRKKFQVREYSDFEYEAELARLHEAFSPLARRCRELGRAMRIGTNHGSLSDRIMNRYGDTPAGMVESALEFLRIAESHDFRDIILSMKSSNPKVMIQAYRLLVERMAAEDMHYPLHLGVTEAGDGEDGRIKSAIGIGSLLLDGLGDTIRVSLTEDSVHEIPVAQAIARKAMSLWRTEPEAAADPADSIDFYSFSRRRAAAIALSGSCAAGGAHPPRVVARLAESDPGALRATIAALLGRPGDSPLEGVLLAAPAADSGRKLGPLLDAARAAPFTVLDLPPGSGTESLAELAKQPSPGLVLLRSFGASEPAVLARFAELARRLGARLAVAAEPASLDALAPELRQAADLLLITLPAESPEAAPPAHRPSAQHALGAYRLLAEHLRVLQVPAPIWIRCTEQTAIGPDATFLGRLLDASILAGGLLCDGIGDVLSIETEADPDRAIQLAYNVLQGAGARLSKTEFVACPSCGRTLFDLQTTTRRIREKTGHLKGVKIAIMGCIVNGPGEMADADFGYVGGAPGRINLYVGKQCVRYNIPQEEADARLIDLIKAHGKWSEPVPAAGPAGSPSLQ